MVCVVAGGGVVAGVEGAAPIGGATPPEVEPLGAGVTVLAAPLLAAPLLAPPVLGVITGVGDAGAATAEVVAVVTVFFVVRLLVPAGGASTAAPVVGTAN